MDEKIEKWQVVWLDGTKDIIEGETFTEAWKIYRHNKRPTKQLDYIDVIKPKGESL